MEYEEIIQKLEADIRKHIRIQNQLKLHIESLQGKVDENEKEGMVKNKEFEDLVEGNKKLKQSLIDIDRRKEDEIKSLKEEHQSEIK
jgi:FtsZ-binding cell division protein ZapB